MSTSVHPLRRGCAGALLLATLALGGCGSVIRLENDVRSYANWQPTAVGEPAPLPAHGDLYRFERRPSQSQGPAAQEQQAIEAIARSALEKVGLRAAPETPGASPLALRWTVEVDARSLRLPHAPWEDDRWPGFGMPGPGYYVNRQGQLVSRGPVFAVPPTPYYQRELSLVMRDARNGQVVYETVAAHDGPWADGPKLWAALLDAALQGFPQPPAGPRRVVIEVPR